MLNRDPFHISIIPIIESASASDFRFIIGPLLMRTAIPAEGYDGIIKAIRSRSVAMLWNTDMVVSVISALGLAEITDQEAATVRHLNSEHHNA